jgi:hypothetical protein
MPDAALSRTAGCRSLERRAALRTQHFRSAVFHRGISAHQWMDPYTHGARFRYTSANEADCCCSVFAFSLPAQMHPLQDLIEAAREGSPRLNDLLGSGLPGLKGRDGAAVWGQEFLFAVESQIPRFGLH